MPFIIDDIATISAAISGATGLLKTLGVRTGTKHLSYNAVLPIAQQFQTQMFPLFKRAYGDGGCIQIAARVTPRFMQAMNDVWGLGASQNVAFRNDISSNNGGTITGSDVLSHQLAIFILWVGTNIDQERPETFESFTKDLFRTIFGGAIADAGLDVNALSYSGGTLQNPTGTVTVPPSGGIIASYAQSAFTWVAVVVIGIILYFVFRKKG